MRPEGAPSNRQFIHGCPCGFANDFRRECLCTPPQIQLYIRNLPALAQPLLRANRVRFRPHTASLPSRRVRRPRRASPPPRPHRRRESGAALRAGIATDVLRRTLATRTKGKDLLWHPRLALRLRPSVPLRSRSRRGLLRQQIRFWKTTRSGNISASERVRNTRIAVHVV
jgi:hypothetical protein